MPKSVLWLIIETVLETVTVSPDLMGPLERSHRFRNSSQDTVLLALTMEKTTNLELETPIKDLLTTSLPKARKSLCRGPLMKTDSSQKVIICPSLQLCPILAREQDFKL